MENGGFITELFKASGLRTPVEFLIALSFVVLGLLIGSAIISMFTIWHLSLYGEKIGASLSNRLYHYYLNQTWLFHANNNSSQLTNKISVECSRITESIINPLMYMNARLVLVIVMAFSILIYNPIVALVGTAIFSFSYFFIYKLMNVKYDEYGKVITKGNTMRFKLMGEGFGGIKDTLLTGRQSLFVDNFRNASNMLATAAGKNIALAQIPKHVIELLAFCIAIFMVLFLLIGSGGNIGTILSILSVFCIAGLKLLPAFQQIYFCAASIRGHLAAFENLKYDLYASSNNNVKIQKISKDRMPLTRALSMKNIFFSYPNTDQSTLNDISFKISANEVIGIVGPSGSGKSTLLDIILGLVTPSSGTILIDGNQLSSKNSRKWQNGWMSKKVCAEISSFVIMVFGMQI